MSIRIIIAIGMLFGVCACDLFVPDIGGENQPCSRTDTCRSGFVCVDGYCCTEQDYQQCSSDGNVHWFTSCDNQGQMVVPCSPDCEDCLDTSASQAECQARGNWLVGSDCSACVGNWDPGWDCEQCTNHWQDETDDCGTCPGNWDPTQDCAVCRSHWVDQDDQCSTCPGNWDAAQDCAACQTGFAGEDCEKVTNCAAQADFTLCEEITVPDYWYDICLDGECFATGACPDASCNPPGPGFVLADSGQRSCYDDTAGIDCVACADTGHCGQDAEYGWDITHEPTERFVRSEPEWTMPVVVDNVTGLMWQGCVPNRNGTNCGNSTTQVRDWSEARDYCDGLTWGGFSDWRLPGRLELQSLVDYGRTGPTIHSEAFPQTESERFWTAAVCADDSSKAWVVHFGFSTVGREARTSGRFLRCVRQNQGR